MRILKFNEDTNYQSIQRIKNDKTDRHGNHGNYRYTITFTLCYNNQTKTYNIDLENTQNIFKLITNKFSHIINHNEIINNENYRISFYSHYKSNLNHEYNFDIYVLEDEYYVFKINDEYSRSNWIVDGIENLFEVIRLFFEYEKIPIDYYIESNLK